MRQANESRIRVWAEAIRPLHWVKNGFVAAPLLFSGKFVEAAMLGRCLVGLVSFCAISSAIYILNDLCDRREDQQHPVKRQRAIARGAIGAQEAVVLALLLTAVSVVAAWWLGGGFVVMVGLYAGVNIAYSVAVKHWVILDVMAIAAGFVLRILAGSVAIGVSSSHWLVLCTIMISVFLGFAKRRAELVSMGTEQGQTRKVLADYSVGFLDQAISVVTGATIICYAMYTVDARTENEFGTKALLLTVPLVMYGMFRYIYVIYHLKEGENPTKAICKDPAMIANTALWIGVSLAVILWGAGWGLFG